MLLEAYMLLYLANMQRDITDKIECSTTNSKHFIEEHIYRKSSSEFSCLMDRLVLCFLAVFGFPGRL